MTTIPVWTESSIALVQVWLFWSASMTAFLSPMSLTVACRKEFPHLSTRMSVTSAENSSPPILLCVHSKRCEPSRIAIPIISLAFSPESRPSGCSGGERSPGPCVKKSASSFAWNSFTVAELQEVKFHDGGSTVIIASRELSKRFLNFSSLFRRFSSDILRSVMSRQ